MDYFEPKTEFVMVFSPSNSSLSPRESIKSKYFMYESDLIAYLRERVSIKKGEPYLDISNFTIYALNHLRGTFKKVDCDIRVRVEVEELILRSSN